MLHQRLRVLIEVRSKRNLSFQDISVDSHWILVVERVDSSVHLVDEHTQRPPINSFSVALIENDFGSDVFGGSTNREGSAFSKEFRKAKVSKFQVAVVSDQKIFRFEISEDDVL